MPAVMLSEDERAFFSAVAGLLPALFIAAILQREETKDPDTVRADLPSWVYAKSLVTPVYCVVIFLMLAGEQAAFHVLRTGHVRDPDFGLVAVATTLLVAVIVGRIIRARTPSDRTAFSLVTGILGGLTL